MWTKYNRICKFQLVLISNCLQLHSMQFWLDSHFCATPRFTTCLYCIFGFSMVKIHFLQKVLKKWSSFRKKINFFFHNQGGRGGGPRPIMEFSIIVIYFFLTLPLLISCLCIIDVGISLSCQQCMDGGMKIKGKICLLNINPSRLPPGSTRINIGNPLKISTYSSLI